MIIKPAIPEEKLCISLSEQREAFLTLPWFVENGRYPPRPHTVIEPLINGARAFPAVHEAIAGATKSIDIISWGFDPSMRLLGSSGQRVGDMLREKARNGVQVRILIWKNALANFAENNIIGDGFLGSGGGSTGVGSGAGSTAAGGQPSTPAHNDYASKVTNSATVTRDDDEARAFNRAWFKHLPANLAFRTRDYNAWQRIDILLEQGRAHPEESSARNALLALFPSHHQKMILVDYETPEQAVGFVMGHNLLRNYWDDDDHAYHSTARLGFKPWQDLSCRVRGPVLFDLNDNFSLAWDDAASWLNNTLPLPQTRQALVPDDFIKAARACGQGEMAQITRTQVQAKNDLSILSSYQLALLNARNYVYFENQYFRYKDFAMQLRGMRRKLKGGGWKRDFYVFVVTNVPDDSGRIATYEMLAALGKADAMPVIHKKSDKKGDTDKEDLRKADLDGVNIHVCTLATHSDTPYEGQSPYQGIYVHSKLLLVDDVFFTVGSANVNVRSMEVDSELCIACPSERLTRQWREHLWGIHTGRAALESMEDEFELWGKIMFKNKRQKDKSLPLISPLLEFYDDSGTGRHLD